MWPSESSASRPLFERALRVMVGGTTRHIPWQDPYPMFAASCQGSRVTDVDGTSVLDLVMNNAALIHGHAHPEVIAPVAQQLWRGTACTLPIEVEVSLAELLCERLPSLEKIRFCNSGTEAVMLAIKAARAYTDRPKIVKVEGIYHGMYDYAEVSLDPTPANWGNDPGRVGYARGVPRGVLDDVIVVPWNQPDTLRRILHDAGPSIAAILLDPVSGGTGMTPPTPEFLDAVHDTARAIGALVIYDEVLCFRLGYHGAQGRFGDRRPDLTVLAKVIGGGFPVGAIGGRSDVMTAVFEHRKGKPRLPASGTFTANPVSMTAGLATMRMLDEAAFDRLEQLGNTVRTVIHGAFEATGVAGQVTGLGSMLAIHLHMRPIHDYRSAFPSPAEAAALRALQLAMLKRGVLITVRGAAYLAGVLTDDDIALLERALRGALAEVAHHQHAKA
jgi:glutamate-1-semialdehyde 2,1-aminomutase